MQSEVCWLEFHQNSNIHAKTYLAGPRYHFDLGRFQPYAKGLVGIGNFNFTYNYAHGRYFVIAPGAGLDYRLNHRLSVRVDGEYQYWPQFTFGPMSSGGVSVGIRYLILR
jgi:opacity protein-like surface antigen